MSKLICIDAGHGGDDSGAPGNGILEKNITLKVAKEIGQMLEKQGISVIYTRTADKDVSLKQRCKTANNGNADLFVSIHINSSENKEARGTETLCYSSNRLAELIQKYLLRYLKLKDRGVKERKDLAVLNGTKMIAVLCELAFLSNKEEAEFIKTDEFVKLSAEAVVKGICEYLGIEFKTENKIEEKREIAVEKTINVVVNGEKDFTQGYFVDGKNLFTADFIRQLGFDVGYDEETKQVIINPKELKLNVDGKEICVEAININGFNFCPVRSLARAVGFDVIGNKENVYLKTI